ncbi:prepilin-type N-terminal cleavage/methylation domain-containing protein [Vibrio sp. 10N.261.55.A7]|uniref:pilin n=1 Tax=Vibrio sp. 10N.261.55.A7 TaxID=1880851 RepID=UPI000C8345BB|nr:prepilin-type N-terminal cleavage/methylation domain-containing protein [Vibrio sp. 10N.261.55.A7]
MKAINKKQKGFTLIELMIVVAIIGVLSAIAVPAYKDYVTKSEAASALATMKSLITPAELIYQEAGEISTGINLVTALGISSGSNTLGTISVDVKDKIKFTFSDNALATETIELERTNSGWECAFSSSTVDLKGCS